MGQDPAVTNLACLGEIVMCTQLFLKIYQINQAGIIFKYLKSYLTYIPSDTAEKRFTCRALIRSHTFSWENTRTGRVGSCPDSGMKILSCERARLPSAPLDSLGEGDTVKLCSLPPPGAPGWRAGPVGRHDQPTLHLFFICSRLRLTPHHVKYHSQLLEALRR